MYIWMIIIFVFVVVASALLALVVGVLVGVFLGGITGGVAGGMKARGEDPELATYRGITWGGCVGGLVGLALAVVSILVAWQYLLVN